MEEDITKDGRAVELSCVDVQFLAETQGIEKLLIENTGNVPIYSVEIKLQGEGEIKEIGNPVGGGTIGAGETGGFNLPAGATLGSTIIVTPVLLGETDEELWPYACDSDYSVEVVVE